MTMSMTFTEVTSPRASDTYEDNVPRRGTRPGDHARHEIAVLRLANGHGCVRPPRADEARGVLLERLGRSLHELGYGIRQRHEILVAAGVIERVSTGLLATRIGLQPAGRRMLAADDYCADRDQPR
jgi:hypothetical protein